MAQKKVPACFWFIDVCFDICAGAVLPPIGKRTKKPSQQTLRAVWQCSATPKASPMNVSSTYFCAYVLTVFILIYLQCILGVNLRKWGPQVTQSLQTHVLDFGVCTKPLRVKGDNNNDHF